MIFLCNENENFLRQHCSPFQDARLYIIWKYLNKLCHECHHNIRHLAWKSWIFVHGSSFLRTLFQDICRILSFLFFLKTRSHIMTRGKGFLLFLFFWILYANFKMRSKLTTQPFLARGWILQNYWRISDEIDSCVTKNDFFKKSWANYEAVVVQIWPGSTWIGRYLSFLWEVYIALLKYKNLVICALNMVQYFYKLLWFKFVTCFF